MTTELRHRCCTAMPLLHPRSVALLHYAVAFPIAARFIGVLGFGGSPCGAVGIARILFLFFIVLPVVSMMFHWRRSF